MSFCAKKASTTTIRMGNAALLKNLLIGGGLGVGKSARQVKRKGSKGVAASRPPARPPDTMRMNRSGPAREGLGTDVFEMGSSDRAEVKDAASPGARGDVRSFDRCHGS